MVYMGKGIRRSNNNRLDTMTKHTTIPIFNHEYKVVVCWGTHKQLYNVLMEHHYHPDYHTLTHIQDETEDRRGVTFKQSRCYPVVWIDATLAAHDAIGTLAHEAVHAVAFVFGDIDETLHHSEVYAHSVGAIVRESLSAMKILTKAKR